MGYPDGTDKSRQVSTDHLPADVQQALADYDRAWSEHRYGCGEFADGYPGQASADASLAEFAADHVVTED